MKSYITFNCWALFITQISRVIVLVVFLCAFFRRKTIHAIALKYIQHLILSRNSVFFFDRQNIAAMYFVCSLNQSSKSLPSIFVMIFLGDFLRLSKTRICKENNNQNKTNQCSQSLFHTSLIQKYFRTKNYKINRNLILLINFQTFFLTILNTI